MMILGNVLILWTLLISMFKHRNAKLHLVFGKPKSHPNVRWIIDESSDR